MTASSDHLRGAEAHVEHAIADTALAAGEQTRENPVVADALVELERELQRVARRLRNVRRVVTGKS